MQTKILADFVSSLCFSDLSPEAVEQSKLCVEDLIGVALAGSIRPQGKIWARYFSGKPAGTDAHVWNTDLSMAFYAHAAAQNAAYAHVIDMDDVHNSSITHMGAVTIPAALAVGQKYHRSGRDVLAAIAAGYETGARIGEAINPSAYHYWHTTGVAGSFSSAVAAGKLMGLDAAQLRSALGSAGTQASGLWEFINDGAMSKSLHTANATLCGIRAAELSLLGFTAAQNILEGERGFLGAMTAHSNPEALTQDLELRNYKILSNSLKPYACCRHTHSAVYCVETILKERSINPADILRITDYTYQVAKDNVDNAHPATPYAFKFSVQYCIAAALLYGSLYDEVFSQAKTDTAPVRQLMDKIQVVTNSQLEFNYQQNHNRWAHRLEIHMANGEVLSKQVDYPFGDFNNPFDWEAEHNKFFTLTRDILPGAKAAALTRRITAFEELDDVNKLFAEL